MSTIIQKQRSLLSIKNLTIRLQTRHGDIFPVQNISCDVKEYEIIGIVGESGSGKTVFALSLARLLPENMTFIDADVMSFSNYNLLNLTKKDWQKIRGAMISYVFQDSLVALNPHLTIGYQLMEPLRIHYNHTSEQAKQIAMEHLKAVQIPDPELQMNRYPHHLSGGMRQRVAIAMALISKPKLLIADEPTTALDATLQAQILNLFKKLYEEKPYTMIIITHDLSLVAGLCQRVWIMYAGKILETAPVSRLFKNPLHPYTHALLSLKYNIGSGKRLQSLPGNPPDLRTPITHCPFAERCPFAVKKCFEQPLHQKEIEPNHITTCWRVIDNEINLSLHN